MTTITAMCSNAVKAALDELAPRLERATGHKIALRFGPAAELEGWIGANQPFDLAILTAAVTDKLIAAGKLDARSRRVIVRSAAGVAIRRGTPRPDIATPEALKRALLAAGVVASSAQGATGQYLPELFARLDIAAEMAGKIRLLPPTHPPAKAVADGEADLALTQMSEILPYPGAELAGPLPPGLQLTTDFPAAIASHAREPAAAAALIAELTSAEAATVYRAKGLEPG